MQWPLLALSALPSRPPSAKHQVAILIQRFICDTHFDKKRWVVVALQELFEEVWFSEVRCINMSDFAHRVSGNVLHSAGECPSCIGSQGHGLTAGYHLPQVGLGVITMHFDAFITRAYVSLTEADEVITSADKSQHALSFDELAKIPAGARGWVHWPLNRRALLGLRDRNVLNASARLYSGHADVYFVPQRMVAEFNRFALEFEELQVLNEIAVPTIFGLLGAWESSVQQRCGSCCFTTRLNRSEACGHKLDLRDATNLEQLEREYELMRQDVPPRGKRRGRNSLAGSLPAPRSGYIRSGYSSRPAERRFVTLAKLASTKRGRASTERSGARSSGYRSPTPVDNRDT